MNWNGDITTSVAFEAAMREMCSPVEDRVNNILSFMILDEKIPRDRVELARSSLKGDIVQAQQAYAR